MTGVALALTCSPPSSTRAAWLIPPLLYDWGCNAFRCMMLVPYTQRRAAAAVGMVLGIGGLALG